MRMKQVTKFFSHSGNQESTGKFAQLLIFVNSAARFDPTMCFVRVLYHVLVTSLPKTFFH